MHKYLQYYIVWYSSCVIDKNWQLTRLIISFSIINDKVYKIHFITLRSLHLFKFKDMQQVKMVSKYIHTYICITLQKIIGVSALPIPFSRSTLLPETVKEYKPSIKQKVHRIFSERVIPTFKSRDSDNHVLSDNQLLQEIIKSAPSRIIIL